MRKIFACHEEKFVDVLASSSRLQERNGVRRTNLCTQDYCFCSSIDFGFNVFSAAEEIDSVKMRSESPMEYFPYASPDVKTKCEIGRRPARVPRTLRLLQRRTLNIYGGGAARTTQPCVVRRVS